MVCGSPQPSLQVRLFVTATFCLWVVVVDHYFFYFDRRLVLFILLPASTSSSSLLVRRLRRRLPQFKTRFKCPSTVMPLNEMPLKDSLSESRQRHESVPGDHVATRFQACEPAVLSAVSAVLSAVSAALALRGAAVPLSSGHATGRATAAAPAGKPRWRGALLPVAHHRRRAKGAVEAPVGRVVRWNHG